MKKVIIIGLILLSAALIDLFKTFPSEYKGKGSPCIVKSQGGYIWGYCEKGGKMFTCAGGEIQLHPRACKPVLTEEDLCKNRVDVINSYYEECNR